MGWWGTRAECGCCVSGGEGGGTCLACSTDHNVQEIQVEITGVVEDTCTQITDVSVWSCTNINGTYVVDSWGNYPCRWVSLDVAQSRYKPTAFCISSYVDLWVQTSSDKYLTIKTRTQSSPGAASEWLEWRTSDFSDFGTFGSLPCCAIEDLSVPFSTRYWTDTISAPTDFGCNASGNSLFSVQRCQPGGSTTCNYGPWQVSSTELSGISGDHSWTSSSNIRVKDSNYATTSADITGPSTETSEYLQSFHDFGSTQNTERIAVQIWGSKPIGTNLRLSDVRIHTSSGALGTQVDGFSPVDLSTTDSLHYFEYTLASATSRSNWWCQIQCDNPSGVDGKPSINYVALQRCT